MINVNIAIRIPLSKLYCIFHRPNVVYLDIGGFFLFLIPRSIIVIDIGGSGELSLVETFDIDSISICVHYSNMSKSVLCFLLLLENITALCLRDSWICC